jgi:hypothetical protein
MGSEMRDKIPATSCTMPATTYTKFHSKWHAAQTLLWEHIGESADREYTTVIFMGI